MKLLFIRENHILLVILNIKSRQKMRQKKGAIAPDNMIFVDIQLNVFG